MIARGSFARSGGADHATDANAAVVRQRRGFWPCEDDSSELFRSIAEVQLPLGGS